MKKVAPVIHKNLILFLLALSMFLVVLDSAIVNVALPAIKDALAFDDTNLQWVVTSYILTFGGFLLLGGRTADLYGRKKVLLAGVGGFTLCSLLIGLSHTQEMLIAFRAIQGLAAAFMAPTALSILLTTFQEGHERNNALSIWALVASGGAAAGVFLGGILTQFLGWEWCFFVNVPIGTAVFFGMKKYIPEHVKDNADNKLDIPGALLVTAGLMSLVYALTLAAESGWGEMNTLIALGSSIALLAGFIFNETKVKHPLMPLSIFKIRNVSGGNLMMLPIIAGALGQFFFLTLYFQNILKFTPVETGLSFLPIPIIIGILSRKAPVLIQKFGVRTLLITGTSLTTIGVFSFSFLSDDSVYWINILPSFLIMATGFGISFVAITVAATSGVPAHQAGLASGILNTSQQVGGALGLAVLSFIASTQLDAKIAIGEPMELATLHSYQHVFSTAAVLMIISVFVAIFVIETQPPTKAKTTKKK